MPSNIHRKSISTSSFNDGTKGLKHEVTISSLNIPSVQDLDALDEPYKIVCLLHFHNNLSRSAIANQLNISQGTVYNRLHRGLYLLKKQLAAKTVMR